MTARGGAMLASFYAGIMFGVFWVPIRALEQAGFEGPWPATLYVAAPVIFTLPIYWRYRADLSNGRGLLGGVLCGIALGLYAMAFLYTDVVRTVLLFYLMPIWGFLLGRIVLGEAVTGLRWMAIALGFAGIAVIFGAESGLPVPENIGDWMALASGMIWAVASILILTNPGVNAWVHCANFFVFATILTVCIALASGIPPPDVALLEPVIWWLLPVALLIALPVGFATVYGATILNPGVVGLLFMGEVAVAAISAAILTDEPFGLREGVGVMLVMAAGLLEPLREIMANDQVAA